MAGGFSVQIEVVGLEKAHKVARALIALGEDTAPLLSIAGSILEGSTRARFASESGPGGIPWPKSKAALGLAPRASGKIQPGLTLQDTGRLLGSIRHEVRPGEVEVGSDKRAGSASFAAAHQFGSHRQTVVMAHRRTINEAFGVPIPAKVVEVRAHGRVTNLPARPFIGVDDGDRTDLAEAWHDHLQGLFNAA